jgi:hypothetical protein
VYSSVLGAGDAPGLTSVAELAAVGLFAAVGVLGGVLSVLVLGLLFWQSGGQYVEFLVVLGAFGIVLGFLTAARACRERVSAGRAGWAMVVSAVVFTVTTMLGLCLTGWQVLARLAVQFPIFLVLVLPVAGAAGAVLVRLGPKLGLRVGSAAYDLRSRTAHTIMMPRDGEESLLSSRRKRAQQQGEPPEER